MSFGDFSATTDGLVKVLHKARHRAALADQHGRRERGGLPGTGAEVNDMTQRRHGIEVHRGAVTGVAIENHISAAAIG